MCSTRDERLARIGRAIDELAADSLAPHRAGSDAGMEDRLARIWAMIAELDPELARRVPDYQPGTAQPAAADQPGRPRDSHGRQAARPAPRDVRLSLPRPRRRASL